MGVQPMTRPIPPPWLSDDSPDCWTELPAAAREYFRKSYQRVYDMLKDGTLEAAGFPTYFDGNRHYVRLPVPLKKR